MLTGASPEVVVSLLEGLGVDVIGMNCSLGPKQMKPIFEKMAAVASVPLVISPNAGLPRTENGHTVYDVTAKEFAEIMEELVHMGAWIVGGCCGTTPEHIKETVDKCRDLEVKPLTDKNITMVSSYSQVVVLEEEVSIGACLNPAENPEAREALEEHDLDYVFDEADEKVDDGADILSISVEVPGIDQVQMIEDVIIELQSLNDTPLQIKTSDMAVLEKALRIYNGKPMICFKYNKVEDMEPVFALIQKYGGALVDENMEIL
jgi:5-methyltetrahydrofolate--homocysteine methyltransferase